MFLEVVKKEVKDFIEEMISFCEQRNIDPCLHNFLYYKKEGAPYSDCVYLLFGRRYSKFFLFNSKKFNRFFSSLPFDFKKDIASESDIQKIKLLTLSDSSISDYLKKVLKKDFIW